MSNGEITSFAKQHWGKVLLAAFALGGSLAVAEIRLEAHERVMIDHDRQSVKSTRLLRLICRHTAKTEIAQSQCNTEWDE